jgi:hypothetical protein
MDLPGQDKTRARRERFIALPALLFLTSPGHLTRGQQTGRFGFEQKFLEFLNCSVIATLASSVYTFLDAENMPLEFLPGQCIPSLT